MTMKKKNHHVFIGLVIIMIIGSVGIANCTTREKISQAEMVRIALNDPGTIRAINSSSFNVTEVSRASWGNGSGSPEEVYSVLIDVTNGTKKQVLVFVTSGGQVVFVDTRYPVIIPSDSMTNNISRPGNNLTNSILSPSETPRS